jgi:hypothetical protein
MVNGPIKAWMLWDAANAMSNQSAVGALLYSNHTGTKCSLEMLHEVQVDSNIWCRCGIWHIQCKVEVFTCLRTYDSFLQARNQHGRVDQW